MFVVRLMMLVAVADQLTKYAVWSGFRLHECRQLIPGLLNFRYIRNDGAAWGLFAGHRWPLVLVSVVMLALLYAHRRELAQLGRLGATAIGLLLGGIVGNLIDRLRFGYVVDYVDVYLGSHHFPAFNVADAAICVGVALYLLASLRGARHGGETAAAREPAAP